MIKLSVTAMAREAPIQAVKAEGESEAQGALGARL